ncbi:MAG: hypothetical protein WA885_04065 [Phormidesmis sp.]
MPKNTGLDSVSQQGKKILNKVTGAVEQTGKQVAEGVSYLTNNQTEEVTEDIIQAAVDQALDIIRVAGDRVRERNINAERVTLEVGVGVVNVAHIRITTDVPEKGADKSDSEEVKVAVSDPE